MSENTHYYIDAYNILFRYSDPSENLKTSRENLIDEINSKLELVPLNISLVFDSYFAIGDSSRSHMPHLEILFTSQGETADQFIIEALKSGSLVQEVVVTSDKELASLARAEGAKTQSVDGFLSWLNRRYKKKLLELKQKPEGTRKSKKNLRAMVAQEIVEPLIPTAPPVQGSLEYYQSLFETRFKELPKENIDLPKKRVGKLKKTTAKPTLEKKINEFDRWLKLFEEHKEDDLG